MIMVKKENYKLLVQGLTSLIFSIALFYVIVVQLNYNPKHFEILLLTGIFSFMLIGFSELFIRNLKIPDSIIVILVQGVTSAIFSVAFWLIVTGEFVCKDFYSPLCTHLDYSFIISFVIAVLCTVLLLVPELIFEKRRGPLFYIFVFAICLILVTIVRYYVILTSLQGLVGG